MLPLLLQVQYMQHLVDVPLKEPTAAAANTVRGTAYVRCGSRRRFVIRQPMRAAASPRRQRRPLVRFWCRFWRALARSCSQQVAWQAWAPVEGDEASGVAVAADGRPAAELTVAKQSKPVLVSVVCMGMRLQSTSIVSSLNSTASSSGSSGAHHFSAPALTPLRTSPMTADEDIWISRAREESARISNEAIMTLSLFWDKGTVARTETCIGLLDL